MALTAVGSLWDMIRIALLKYIQLGARVQNADKIFETLQKLSEPPGLGIVGQPSDSISIKRISDEDKIDVAATLAFAANACGELSLPISADLLKQALRDLPETLQGLMHERPVHLKVVYKTGTRV
jgi:hypothetical protein